MLLNLIEVINLENQLIVYVPKKNVKKIILLVILGLLLSIIVFCASAFSSAIISLKTKVPKIDTSNFMKTTFQYENIQDQNQ